MSLIRSAILRASSERCRQCSGSFKADAGVWAFIRLVIGKLGRKIILVLRLRHRLRLLNGFRVVQGVSDRGLRGLHSRTDPGRARGRGFLLAR